MFILNHHQFHCEIYAPVKLVCSNQESHTNMFIEGTAYNTKNLSHRAGGECSGVECTNTF